MQVKGSKLTMMLENIMPCVTYNITISAFNRTLYTFNRKIKPRGKVMQKY